MLLYFDTSVFLMLFKEEVENQKYMPGLLAIMSRFEADKVEIITSTIAIAEIMPKRTGNPAYEKIISMFGSIDIRPVDILVAELAAHLRDTFQSDNPSNDSKLKTPDAIHLATALDRKAKYLCTIDEKLIKLGRNSKLIKEVAGRKINIINTFVPEFGTEHL